MTELADFSYIKDSCVGFFYFDGLFVGEGHKILLEVPVSQGAWHSVLVYCFELFGKKGGLE